eukprot:7798683-Alexandrium_andersonii.AAC.1
MTPAVRGAWRWQFPCHQQHDTLQLRLRPREDAEQGEHIEGHDDEESSSGRCWTSGLKAMTPAVRGAWQWRFPRHHQQHYVQLPPPAAHRHRAWRACRRARRHREHVEPQQKLGVEGHDPSGKGSMA